MGTVFVEETKGGWAWPVIQAPKFIGRESRLPIYDTGCCMLMWLEHCQLMKNKISYENLRHIALLCRPAFVRFIL